MVAINGKRRLSRFEELALFHGRTVGRLWSGLLRIILSLIIMSDAEESEKPKPQPSMPPPRPPGGKKVAAGLAGDGGGRPRETVRIGLPAKRPKKAE